LDGIQLSVCGSEGRENSKGWQPSLWYDALQPLSKKVEGKLADEVVLAPVPALAKNGQAG
jgi:hypothetical protein